MMCGIVCMAMLFLCITTVESLSIRGLQNSSARTCESNKRVISNLGGWAPWRPVFSKKMASAASFPSKSMEQVFGNTVTSLAVVLSF